MKTLREETKKTMRFFFNSKVNKRKLENLQIQYKKKVIVTPAFPPPLHKQRRIR